MEAPQSHRPAFFVIFLAAIVAMGEAGIHRREACYGDLGCFEPIGSNNLPATPEHINTSFLLATRDNPNALVDFVATASTEVWSEQISNSSFSAQKETKFVTHGFNSESRSFLRIKDELLKKGDFNVFLVDWKHGAANLNYDQSASNTFVVAAQLAKFIKWLQTSNHLDSAKLHLIGHSLGAHISGNAGSKVHGVGRITGLDPASPRFNDFDLAMRLDSTDARFVDIIHSDGTNFTASKGFGMAKAVGHIDFYPNGGSDQPGCTDDEVLGLLGILSGNPDNSLSCSHSRAVAYFQESINSACKFLAHTCADWITYDQDGCNACPEDGCPIMGFEADKTSARGSFYLSTAQSSPYCGNEYYVEMDLSDEVVDSRGRIYITLLGDSNNSTEVEFTRDFRQYHANDQEKHVIAVHQTVGTLTGVRVKFTREKRLGEAPQGHDNHVTIHRIIVKDRATQNKIIFCTRDITETDLQAVTFLTDPTCS